MLNGIDDLATRSDLLDRSIAVYLPKIETRKPQSEFWDSFKKAQPRILGAVLDALSEALRNVDNVKLKDYPRMADFTKLATAAEKALGLTDNEFVKIYNQNRDNANKIAVEMSPIAPIIFELLQEKEEWVGIAKDLKIQLDARSSLPTQANYNYPKSPQQVSGKLRRLAPNLRAIGIDISIGEEREGGTGDRLIKIRKVNSNLSHCHNSSQNNQSSKEEKPNEGCLF